MKYLIIAMQMKLFFGFPILMHCKKAVKKLEVVICSAKLDFHSSAIEEPFWVYKKNVSVNIFLKKSFKIIMIIVI